MRFTPTELTQEELRLQQDVRDFLLEELPPGSHDPCLGMAARRDKEFSLKMAERGWVGMALPKEWGGSDRTAVDRFIVVEEMLRWGAPVGHHWVADRQTGKCNFEIRNPRAKREVPSLNLPRGAWLFYRDE